MTIDPIEQFGVSIFDLLARVRKSKEVVGYSKIEGDEFLKFPEDGFYLQSKSGLGIVSDCRIFFQPRDDFFAAKPSIRGVFSNLHTMDDFEGRLGPPIKEIRSFKIPGAGSTLAGKMFEYEDKKVTVYSEDGVLVAYIHVKAS